MELRHLRYFISVAKHLHFSEAAQELNISQPPLSKQIKQLEEEIGAELFYRNNRKVELTEAGKYFYSTSINLLNQLEREVFTVREIHEGAIGSLRIGFGGSVVYDFLPKIIKIVNKLYPDLKLELQQLTSNEQVKSLLDGSIDIGLLVPPVLNDKIAVLPVREESFVVCMPSNHRLACDVLPIDIKEFSNDKIIMTPEKSGKGYYDLIMSLFTEAGFYPDIIQTAQEQQTIVSLVASELGIAFVPESTQRIVHENVRYLPIKQQTKKITALAWNKENYRPSIKLFKNMIETHF